MPKVTLEGWKCLRCEHQWLPRDNEHPKVCPKCKSPYWDTPRRIDLQKPKDMSIKEKKRLR